MVCTGRSEELPERPIDPFEQVSGPDGLDLPGDVAFQEEVEAQGLLPVAQEGRHRSRLRPRPTLPEVRHQPLSLSAGRLLTADGCHNAGAAGMVLGPTSGRLLPPVTRKPFLSILLHHHVNLLIQLLYQMVMLLRVDGEPLFDYPVHERAFL